MADMSALKKSPETASTDLSIDLTTDLRAERTNELRKKVSGLGGLKITSVSKKEEPKQAEERDTFDLEEESLLVLGPAARVPMATTGKIIQALYVAAGILTAIWIVYG